MVQRLVAKEREVGMLKCELEKLNNGLSADEEDREKEREKGRALLEREQQRNRTLADECNRLRESVSR